MNGDLDGGALSGMSGDEFAELAAGHALGALAPDDERAFEAALRARPELTGIADADAAVAALLAETVIPVAPPPELRAALLSRIADLPQDTDAPQDPAIAGEASVVVPEATRSASGAASASAEPREAPGRAGATPAAPRRRRMWFALAASLALLLAVGAGTFAVVTQLVRPAAVVALDRITSAPDAQEAQTETPEGGVATLHWSESVGEAVFVSDGLPRLGGDKDYELWFVRDGEPISAGVFVADADGSASALLTGTMAPGDVVAVTIEPAGGSPDGLPSSAPILAIPTA